VAQPVRVAVWSTGWVGSIAIRSIHRRADLELVGVWVHSPEKDGQDVGELVGIGPIGMAATNDADALLALRPDCVVYAASGPERDAVAVPDYVRMLEAGINVVTVSSAGLVFPAGFDAGIRERLATAAAAGGASLYASGIEPGFAGDHLVLTLATQSDTIRSIRTQELFLYDEYPVAFMMYDVFGFGRPMDTTPLMSLNGAQLGTWGPPVRYVAHGLGVELDDIRETYERRVTDRTLEVACGVIEAGTCGAIRMETIGVIDGRDAIVIEHVNRMAPDIAPDWPTGPRDGTYRIVIEGEPTITCEMLVGREGTASADGMVATTMRILNAVPFVVDAPAGLLSSQDLPLTLPRNPFATAAPARRN
jgi:2,4-diaminopentanoate dehydrogenase